MDLISAGWRNNRFSQTNIRISTLISPNLVKKNSSILLLIL
jgi:hypothetical protein